MPGINSNQVYLLGPDQDATTGAVAVAELGTDKPADARVRLDAGKWSTSLGYIGEDGITIDGLMAAGDAIKDWGRTKIRVTSGDADPTISIPAIQIDEALASLIVGKEGVTAKPATKASGNQVEFSIDGSVGPALAWCFSMKDGNRRARVFAPNAQVTAVESLAFSPTSANKYGLTISLNADSHGKCVYFMYDDGAVTAS
ncbi:hypothetical protein HLV35_07530 [Eggerthellaceae bacterium zg-997]|nr:hypothetical protein [Eggerthellaceae bacterium zg-997]